jgi:hypothetical protein
VKYVNKDWFFPARLEGPQPGDHKDRYQKDQNR